MVKTVKHKLNRAEVIVAYQVQKNQIVPSLARDWSQPHDPAEKTLYDIQVTILKCIENLMSLAGIAA